MEVSALKYSGGIGLHGRSPLLRLQSDERLVALIRRGNMAAFEMLVSRYQSRLLAFCRHMLGSREDAEDVLQDALAAAYNAMLADTRPINVRPWLYRIARNRCLNHMRRAQAIGVDSMDIHLSEHGATTADKAGEREEFRLLIGDIQGLPETQRTALVLREMDALSYEQIAEAMETTVPSVKSLLVRARISLAEAAEARMLSCDDVRSELGQIAEGLIGRPGPAVRRHLKSCGRCASFNTQMKHTTRALGALLPIGPFALLHKLVFIHFGHSAGAGAAAHVSGTAAGASTIGTGAGVASAGAATAGAVATSTGSIVSAGIGALATKAAAGLAAAAIVTAGAVDVGHNPHPALSPSRVQAHAVIVASSLNAGVTRAATNAPAFAMRVKTPPPAPRVAPAAHHVMRTHHVMRRTHHVKHHAHAHARSAPATATALAPATTSVRTIPPVSTPVAATPTAPVTTQTAPPVTTQTAPPATAPVDTTAPVTTASDPTATTGTDPSSLPGRTATTTDPTVLPPSEAGQPAAAATPAPTLTPTTITTTSTTSPTTTTPTTTTPTTTTPTTTTPTTTTPATTTPATTNPANTVNPPPATHPISSQ